MSVPREQTDEVRCLQFKLNPNQAYSFTCLGKHWYMSCHCESLKTHFLWSTYVHIVPSDLKSQWELCLVTISHVRKWGGSLSSPNNRRYAHMHQPSREYRSDGILSKRGLSCPAWTHSSVGCRTNRRDTRDDHARTSYGLAAAPLSLWIF